MNLLRLAFRAFDNRTGGDVAAEAFTLDHGKLEAWPDGRLVARHIDNQWHIDGRTFVRFECDMPVMCVFEGDDATEKHGPFDGLACVDGVLWVDSHALAALKEGQWSSMVTKQCWPRLRLFAEAPSKG
jgi:hypothetical protein